MVQKHIPEKTEPQCRNVIKTWLEIGVLEVGDYHNEKTRKDAKGLKVDRPRAWGAMSKMAHFRHLRV